MQWGYVQSHQHFILSYNVAMCSLHQHLNKMCWIFIFLWCEFPALYISSLLWHAVYKHLIHSVRCFTSCLCCTFAPLHMNSDGHLLLVCIIQHHIATFTSLYVCLCHFVYSSQCFWFHLLCYVHDIVYICFMFFCINVQHQPAKGQQMETSLWLQSGIFTCQCSLICTVSILNK